MKLIEQTFAKIENRFVSLTSEEVFKREASFALQSFAKNDYLNKATTESKLQAVLNVANTGLTLNPVNPMAYLVPRYNKDIKAVECCLQPSYQGLIKLITDTGSVTSVDVQIVYQGDEFDLILGTEKEITHRKKFQSTDIQLVYAVATLHDGTKQVEVMTIEECHAVREYSESYKAYKSKKVFSCVWIDNEGEMCRKTVLKRISKYLPKTDRWEKLNAAIGLDNQEYDMPASHEQISYAHSLVNTSTFDDDYKSQLEAELMTEITNSGISKMITHLKGNQSNPTDREGFNKTEALNRVEFLANKEE